MLMRVRFMPFATRVPCCRAYAHIVMLLREHTQQRARAIACRYPDAPFAEESSTDDAMPPPRRHCLRLAVWFIDIDADAMPLLPRYATPIRFDAATMMASHCQEQHPNRTATPLYGFFRGDVV